jgi:mono/diheme cytochrome c family protein
LVGTIACTSSAESPASGAKGAGSTAAAPERGKALYKANCVACHGETGKGDGPGAGVLNPKPRDHTNATYMSTLSDDEIGKIIRMGGAIKNMPQMPSHPQINGQDLTALVGYVRSLSQPAASH